MSTKPETRYPQKESHQRSQAGTESLGRARLVAGLDTVESEPSIMDLERIFRQEQENSIEHNPQPSGEFSVGVRDALG
ncbi:unnamed protein product [Protopolystoma xenopodis]|uniref:Uncharacterized protein n=1 Tax=Protopolystoma xenopodis TaxID=117903 RepID=A0A3S5BNH0_9PLAT|nr:unnamed protein product [Protopolystoma xenopodis]